jgi:hypothetical protein
MPKKRRRALSAAYLMLTVGVFAFPSVARTSDSILVGRSGRHNSFVIRLLLPSGRLVTRITEGTYTFVIHDYSKFHNFALGSQTENKRLFTTGIRWVGVKRYTLTLTPGNYAYACSAHFRTMNGTFVVTAASP